MDRNPIDRSQLELAYEHLGLDRKGLSKAEFMQRPLKYLRLYGQGALKDTKSKAN
jgi:hypothetical protein